MEEVIPILYNCFLKVEAEEIFSNSFYESNITLIPKPDKELQENYRPICLTNIDPKFLKILANQIQQCVKTITYHDQLGYIPRIHSGSTTEN
jgi:hypothetical protein